MPTPHARIVPLARVLLGDTTVPYVHQDELLLNASRLAAGFLASLQYDKGHTTSWDAISPDLTEKELFLWAKAVQILVNYPELVNTAVNASSIRTEEVQYSTETAGRISAVVAIDHINIIRSAILALTPSAVATRPDFGMQLGKASPFKGTDPFDD